MKPTLLLVLFLFISRLSEAQNFNGRNIAFKNLGRDSVSISLGDDYRFIEDTCASIVRYGHFSRRLKVFSGKFKDILKGDPSRVLTIGEYDNYGRRHGYFVINYPNGNLHAKGNYSYNNYYGRWTVFYRDGTPSLVFEFKNGVYKVWDAWLPDGTRTVENGKGEFKVDGQASYWKGAILNGRPDGNWKLCSNKDNTVYSTEYFEKGQFREGSSDYSTSSGRSMILLINIDLPFRNAEFMTPSFQNCDAQ